MNFLICNESIKKNKNKCRRIISKYLPQIGKDTFLGPLDEKSIQQLQTKLQEVACKNTCVICRKIISNKTNEIYFIVGSQKNIGQDGTYAFKTETYLQKKELPQNNFIILLQFIGQAIGLLHDFGKSMQHFQYKIRKLSDLKTDPVRHDLFSALMLLYFLKTNSYEKENTNKRYLSERQLLKKFLLFTEKDWNNLYQHTIKKIDKQIQKESNLHSMLQNYLNVKCDKKNKKYYPIFIVILQTILGHHFNPKTTKEEQNLDITKFIHGYKEFNYNNQTKKQSIESLQLFSNNPPWKSTKWQTEFRKTIQGILKYYDAQLDLVTLSMFTSMIVRPAFSAADQLISNKYSKIPYQENDKEQKIFANPCGDEMGQPLVDHLIAVGNQAKQNIWFIKNEIYNQRLDFIEKLPTKLLNKTLDDRFKWQDVSFELAKKTAKQHQENIKGHPNKDFLENRFPFFGLVTSSTGCGKTKGIPKIMGGLSGDKTRYTLGLGLRTLTEQTGRNYIDNTDIGFTKTDDVSVLIGGEFKNYDFENEKEELKVADKIYGTEFISVDSDFPQKLAGPIDDANWNNKNSKLAKMLQVPILVCTIDHLMAAFTSIKTNDSKRINRIINADLVIDEIDSFNYEDLSALTILIYIAGVFGRKVLLSSATINPYLAKAYQHIYMQGYQQFCRIYQINNLEIKYFFGLFNEFPDCCIVETCSSNNFVSKFSNSIDSYYHKTIKNLDKCIPKRKVGFMDVLPKNFKPGIEENIQYVCKKVSNKISQLHNDFHESQNKKNISIGLIRVANTTNGFYFFENLVNCYNGKKEEVQKRKRLFLFYHSKLSANSLKIVEDELNELLKRKNSKKIWKNKIIRKILKKYPDVSDFEIVIVATPIEEVGRDHDFDWCILEPVSVWSLIQIIGRIMRHREFNIKEHRSPNVVILSHDLKYLFCGKKGQSYQKPGPNIKNNLDITRSAQDLFPVEIRDMADSRYCFYINKEEIETNTKNKINALEFFNFKNGIYDNFCKNENIFNELNTYTTHKFDVVYPFRKQHMFDLFCEEKDKEIKIKGRYGKNYFFDREILNNFINGKEGIFLNPYMSSDFFNEKISQRLQVYITKSQSFFIYHPYFGFIQKKDMFWV